MDRVPAREVNSAARSVLTGLTAANIGTTTRAAINPHSIAVSPVSVSTGQESMKARI